MACENVSPSKQIGPVLADAESVRQNGTGGRWLHETPYKEELELVRYSTNMRFEGVLMRQACNAGKSGELANYVAELCCCCWYRATFSLFLLVFSVTQAIAE